jgi:glycosyltransferase involved in cell wall biosynthesis
VRLVASSWSDNPRKGGPLLAELERVLDPKRFELTFVGRTQSSFQRVEVVPPLDSAALAALLGEQDVYLALSRDEPCSNALLEALACGLPVLYLDSGSNGELVGAAGLGFTDVAAAPDLLERLVADHDAYRAAIAVTPLSEVAAAYWSVLGLG